MKIQRLKDGRLRDAGTGRVLKDAMSPEERKKKFAFVKSKIHPDYKGASGILVNKGGRGTVLANEKTIREEDLNKLYKQFGGR